MVEVADDVDEQEDVLVGEAVRSQRIQILTTGVLRCDRELDGEVDDRALTRRQLGGGRILLDLLDELVIFGNLTEILPVSLRSVVTVVDFGNDCRHHLSLGAGETGRA